MNENKETVSDWKENWKEEIKNHKRRRGVVWPIILIFLGSILLLNNLDILPWGVWDSLWRFWPLIVIFVGMNMIWNKSGLGSFLVGIIFAVVVILITTLVVARYNSNFNAWLRINFPNWSYFENLVPQPENTFYRQMPTYNY